MQSLEKSLRNTLEKTVREARDVAEAAARAALEQLGVGEPAPYPHFIPAERELRLKLRIHGRQLGDVRDPKTESQEIDRLIEEVAYEHWHGMLFARFLAENDLLMLPDGSVSISLKECEDLAEEEGARNGWELASRYAAKMLPQIFRPNSPVFELVLPPEYELKLEKLVANLPFAVFIASDSLGWVYQFWQAKRKDEVNESGVKIGARELPSQTQLFTEPYMVQFLLDNSLGAWWMARKLSDNDFKTATSEIELREKAALPGVPLTYLRLVQDESKRWTPAAGTFDTWPEHLKDFKVLDPCCGSGHFLVAALLMLVPIRMEREGLTAKQAVDSVINENLHGLEIDQRCVELAAFAVALTAWNYPNTDKYRKLPELAIACSGLAINARKEEWIALAKRNKDLEYALDILHDQFLKAPVLGSLIDPTSFEKGNIVSIDWKNLEPLLKKALSDQIDERAEMGVIAQGITRSASILAGKYHWIITNVPYLAIRKQGTELREFFAANYLDAKNDIATVFLNRSIKLCKKGGIVNVVLPQNWLFLKTYAKFRENLLKNETWHFIARLGPQGFRTPMWDFNIQLLIISRENSGKGSMIHCLDASKGTNADKKSEHLLTEKILEINQLDQLKNPNNIISFEQQSSLPLFLNYAYGYSGISTGDTPQFEAFFWEINNFKTVWEFEQSTVLFTQDFGGRYKVILWEHGDGQLRKYAIQAKEKLHDVDRRGSAAWGLIGIAISQMGKLPCTIYTGSKFDVNNSVIIPKNQDHLLAIWAYLCSKKYCSDVRGYVSQELKVTTANLLKVPFDLEYWTKIAAEKYPLGLPKPYSDDPTQWIFHGHPAKSESPLQVAVARLLGYRWPAELDLEMELSDEQRAWVKKCDSLLRFTDDDGIVCIPSIRGEPAAADRLLSLLAASYGDKWSNDVLSQLLTEADHEGKTLETWLRERFFSQHCKLFQNRPFIWQIWDGLGDGFSVLVNYHNLDHKTMEILIHTYLGDWISRQKHDIVQGIDGAQERLNAAEVLKKRLELILNGENPYDIFVRWKPLDQQPIGWNPDLNDGVRLNIRPFLSVPDVGKKGAGVLRDKPNIKREKDRGQDVESAPWYHLGPEYGGKDGDRINDHHLKLEEKKKARGIN